MFVYRINVATGRLRHLTRSDISTPTQVTIATGCDRSQLLVGSCSNRSRNVLIVADSIQRRYRARLFLKRLLLYS